jgi:hypothetical protein
VAKIVVAESEGFGGLLTLQICKTHPNNDDSLRENCVTILSRETRETLCWYRIADEAELNDSHLRRCKTLRDSFGVGNGRGDAARPQRPKGIRNMAQRD